MHNTVDIMLCSNLQSDTLMKRTSVYSILIKHSIMESHMNGFADYYEGN